MGRTFDEIDDGLREFIARQRMFFVATAPLALDGLVNLSPKGLDSFRVLDARTVAYLDLTGSGVETIAHLRENARVTVMFCAFDGPPRILRLYGRGEAIFADDPEFDALVAQFPTMPGTRAVIRVAVARIADSCGYAVPRYEFRDDRRQLLDWAERKGSEGITAYQAQKNSVSLDGLPGVTPALRKSPRRATET